MEEIFVTITGMNNYYGFKPFRVGKIFKLTKDEDNNYDCEAIRAEMPMIDTIGYVANSTKTVYNGTYSAGRLYDKIGDHAFAQTMFITHSSVIARVLPPEAVEEITVNLETDDNAPAEETETSAPLNKIGF